jgi:hypothetical protein
MTFAFASLSLSPGSWGAAVLGLVASPAGGEVAEGGDMSG